MSVVYRKAHLYNEDETRTVCGLDAEHIEEVWRDLAPDTEVTWTECYGCTWG